MSKEIKVGDVKYLGTLRGVVIIQYNDNTIASLRVKFENGYQMNFTKDGRFFHNTPILLTDKPCEFEYKEVQELIEKDTIVWYRDLEDEAWGCGFYSHFEDGKHYVYNNSKNSNETEDAWWQIVTTKNPLL